MTVIDFLPIFIIGSLSSGGFLGCFLGVKNAMYNGFGQWDPWVVWDAKETFTVGCILGFFGLMGWILTLSLAGVIN